MDEFSERYKILTHSKNWELSPSALSKIILSSTVQGHDKYQIGKTKIFLRAGEVINSLFFSLLNLLFYLNIL